jgi:hypothetical protein
LVQQLARDLAAVRHSVEQFAAKQEQMARNVATLQAGEQDIRQKMPSPSADSGETHSDAGDETHNHCLLDAS